MLLLYNVCCVIFSIICCAHDQNFDRILSKNTYLRNPLLNGALKLDDEDNGYGSEWRKLFRLYPGITLISISLKVT